jgi:hypothetical protein
MVQIINFWTTHYPFNQWFEQLNWGVPNSGFKFMGDLLPVQVECLTERH